MTVRYVIRQGNEPKIGVLCRDEGASGKGKCGEDIAMHANTRILECILGQGRH